MRVVFLGTGEIAIPSFEALLRSEHEVKALVTQPDKPVGKKGVITPPAIKVVSQAEGIPVLQPEKIRSKDALEELAGLKADVFVVMAYGQILPKALLEIPGKAIINLHASLLPKYRGASCLQAAIAAGDKETGWSVMHVVPKLDAGDVILVKRTGIGEEETGESLHDRMAEMGPEALMEALRKIENGEAERSVQNEAQVVYAPKLEREHGRLDWSKDAVELERMIRAYHTWPGTFTTYYGARNRERRLKIFPQTRVGGGEGAAGAILQHGDDGMWVACGNGSLLLNLVQPEGKRRMEASEFLRGAPVERLG